MYVSIDWAQFRKVEGSSVAWGYFGIYGLGLLDLVWFRISPGGLDQ